MSFTKHLWVPPEPLFGSFPTEVEENSDFVWSIGIKIVWLVTGILSSYKKHLSHGMFWFTETGLKFDTYVRPGFVNQYFVWQR